MDPDDLIESVTEQMSRLKLTQAELAKSCGLSQPHVSKVLSKKVKLASKTAQRFSIWLERSPIESDSAGKDAIRSLARCLEMARPNRRMQIMEFLRAFERLLSE